MSKFDTLMTAISGIFDKSKQNKNSKFIGNYIADVNEAAMNCREEIGKFQELGTFPSPVYFEKVADLSRTTNHLQNEIEICEMYIRLANEYIKTQKPSKLKIDHDIMPLCEEFQHRIHNAKANLSNSRNIPVLNNVQ